MPNGVTNGAYDMWLNLVPHRTVEFGRSYDHTRFRHIVGLCGLACLVACGEGGAYGGDDGSRTETQARAMFSGADDPQPDAGVAEGSVSAALVGDERTVEELSAALYDGLQLVAPLAVEEHAQHCTTNQAAVETEPFASTVRAPDYPASSFQTVSEFDVIQAMAATAPSADVDERLAVVATAPNEVLEEQLAFVAAGCADDEAFARSADCQSHPYAMRRDAAGGRARE
jgi:hypothetical protein